MLAELRLAHADYFFGIQYKLSRQEWMAKNQLVYTMQADRWRTVQGRRPPVMTPYESQLAQALAPARPPEAGQLKAALLALFAKFALFDGKVHQKPGLHLHLEGAFAALATRTLPTQMIKTDRLTVEHSKAAEGGGSGPTADKRLAHITPAAERRRGPGLHRELFRPLDLPAGASPESRAGTLHRGASGVPPLVCRRSPQPGAGPHPGGKASGRTGPAAGRAEPGLLF